MPDGIIEKTSYEILKYANPYLPIKPKALASKLGIKVLTYEDYIKATGSNVKKIIEKHGEDGFTVYVNGVYGIFYNPGNIPRNRWTITHELSHIFLNHLKQGIYCKPSTDGVKNWTDVQADAVVVNVLCPQIVVHFCNVESVFELKELCDLSSQASNYRWNSLCKRRYYDNFRNISSVEMDILNHFRPFINKYLQEKIDLTPIIDLPELKSARYRL